MLAKASVQITQNKNGLPSRRPFCIEDVSLANPVLHMVNAFRYGILGVSDIKIGIAITFMLVATVVLYLGCARLLVSGRGMRT